MRNRCRACRGWLDTSRTCPECGWRQDYRGAYAVALASVGVFFGLVSLIFIDLAARHPDTAELQPTSDVMILIPGVVSILALIAAVFVGKQFLEQKRRISGNPIQFRDTEMWRFWMRILALTSAVYLVGSLVSPYIIPFYYSEGTTTVSFSKITLVSMPPWVGPSFFGLLLVIGIVGGWGKRGR